jgi:hypothetical protein
MCLVKVGRSVELAGEERGSEEVARSEECSLYDRPSVTRVSPCSTERTKPKNE